MQGKNYLIKILFCMCAIDGFTSPFYMNREVNSYTFHANKYCPHLQSDIKDSADIVTYSTFNEVDILGYPCKVCVSAEDLVHEEMVEEIESEIRSTDDSSFVHITKYILFVIGMSLLTLICIKYYKSIKKIISKYIAFLYKKTYGYIKSLKQEKINNKVKDDNSRKIVYKRICAISGKEITNDYVVVKSKHYDHFETKSGFFRMTTYAYYHWECFYVDKQVYQDWHNGYEHFCTYYLGWLVSFLILFLGVLCNLGDSNTILAYILFCFMGGFFGQLLLYFLFKPCLREEGRIRNVNDIINYVRPVRPQNTYDVYSYIMNYKEDAYKYVPIYVSEEILEF